MNDLFKYDLGNLQFPNEWIDTESSRIECEVQKNGLYKKYLARPPSKRINYLKNGTLSPFSCPWLSIQKLHQSTPSQAATDKPFFILKNRRLIRKLENLFFNKNGQLKQAYDLNAGDMELINNSYLGVRLTGHGKVEFFFYSKDLGSIKFLITLIKNLKN